MQLREDYQRDGYVILRDFLSPKELLLLNELVDEVFTQWQAKYAEEIRQHRLINMHSLTYAEYFADQPEQRVNFFKAIAPTKLVELLDEIFERDIYFHNTQLFFNPEDADQAPYWHRDLQFSPIEDEVQRTSQAELLSLHVRIPLVKEQGLGLIPGSHRRWDSTIEKQVRFEVDGHQNSESLPDAVVLELEPGDIVIFNAQMIHRGHYEGNEVRKALDLCVGAAHELTCSALDPANLPSEKELELLPHDVWYHRAWEVIGQR